MRIKPEPPLVSLPMEDVESFYELAHYFRDEDFDDRYFPKLAWFKGRCTRFESVLNLGCSRGRETFALIWHLKLMRAVGIDIDYDRIGYTQKIARIIQTFRRKYCAQNPPSFGNRQYTEELQRWCERGVPSEIRKGNLPEFVQEDISGGIAHPDDCFDLIYGRYVLWQVGNKQRNSLLYVVRNIARVVRPAAGHVVLVEPK